MEVYLFGWVRLAGTRITYIFNEPPPPREITIDNVKITLTRAETTNLIPEDKDSANLKVLFELKNFVFAKRNFFFFDSEVFVRKEESITFEANFYFSPYELVNLSLDLYSTENQLNKLLTDIYSNTTCWVQTINEQDNEPRVFYYYSRLNTYLTNNVITWLTNNKHQNYKELKKKILNLLTEPYIPKKERLNGKQANYFFWEEGTSWSLKLEKLNEHYILVAEL